MALADRDTLEALFRSTGGDTWEKKKKKNWATDAQLSTWSGIGVDKDGRVEVLSVQHALRGIIQIMLACGIL